MRSILTILTGIMLVCSAMAENVTALRPAINDAAAQHGVDPVLMEAIIRHESANATSSAARRKNNLAGIMGKRGQRKYESKEACVQDLARLLA
ncbi:MAG: glucosaminidase domain-containing protein, partial [Akkermansia sp.]|nr:glucosaminidase domain-containing protein [Akkermansia sp.]